MNQILTNNSEILVSVDMITYKHEQYIAQAIEGVLMQETNFNYELVIANDCSPDDTDAIVKHYINNHPKGHIIKYFRHEKNIGMNANGNFAHEQCIGKYIALCEGDDYWTDPFKLQKQVDFLNDNDTYVATFHKAKLVNSNNELIGHQPEINANSTFVFDDLVKGWFIPTASLLYKNILDYKVFANYNNVVSGDRLLTTLLADKGNFYYMNEIMGAYRKHSGGISSYGDRLMIFKNNVNLFEQLSNNLSIKRKKSLNKQSFYWRVRVIEEYRLLDNYVKSYQEWFLLLTKISSYNDVKTVIKLFFKQKIS